jgi:hypothetical protein
MRHVRGVIKPGKCFLIGPQKFVIFYSGLIGGETVLLAMDKMNRDVAAGIWEYLSALRS